MSREDPKHGRWILPLVVAGLIGFTYVFVNALPAAEVTTPDTTVAGGSSTTSTTEAATTTTTTLDPVLADFIETTNQLEDDVTGLADLAQQLNDDWDTDAAGYSETRDGLEDLQVQTRNLAQTVAGIEAPPSATGWQDVVDGIDDMETAAAGMISGLVDAPGPEPRQQALDDYRVAAASIVNALASVREDVVNPAA